MADKFTMLTPEEAVTMVQKLVNLFGIPEVKIDFDSPECKNLWGCYIAKENLLILHPENGTLPGYVVAHELGHALQAVYTGDGGPGLGERFTYSEGEGFASFMQSLYLNSKGAIVDFKCACGQSLVRILPDGSLQCVNCGTQYYVEVYNPMLVKGYR